MGEIDMNTTSSRMYAIEKLNEHLKDLDDEAIKKVPMGYRMSNLIDDHRMAIGIGHIFDAYRELMPLLPNRDEVLAIDESGAVLTRKWTVVDIDVFTRGVLVVYERFINI